MDKVMEMYNKSKLFFVNLVVSSVALFVVLVMSFVSADLIIGEISLNYSDISDWSWLVMLLLVATIGGNAMIVYMAKMNKKDSSKEMMITLLSLLTGAIASILILFEIILRMEDDLNLDMGFYFYAAAVITLLAANSYHVVMNKEAAMNTMKGMRGDVQKKMDEQIKNAQDMDSSNNMQNDSTSKSDSSRGEGQM